MVNLKPADLLKINEKKNPQQNKDITQFLEQVVVAMWPLHNGHIDCCVGLSGGVDSVVLLSILAKLRQLKPLNLTAIHVNHGISANAGCWQDFCQHICQNLNINLSVSQLKVSKKPGVGLENSARLARYFEYRQSGANLIALAHHQDDQLETLFSQLLRGSDVHNLAAMRVASQKQGQSFWRPLLTVSKAQILEYASINQLQYVQDESNADNQYLRNFLRNSILPQLQSYDPMLEAKILNSLNSLQAAASLNDELAELDYQSCQLLLAKTSNLILDNAQHSLIKDELNLSSFKQLSLARQHNLLAYFIRKQELGLPSTRQLEEFSRQVLSAAPDRHPELKLTANSSLKRFKTTIAIVLRN